VSRYLAAQEDNHLSNYFVYINRLSLRSTLLEHADPAVDQTAETYVATFDTDMLGTHGGVADYGGSTIAGAGCRSLRLIW
jgi:hypothetical protein